MTHALLKSQSWLTGCKILSLWAIGVSFAACASKSSSAADQQVATQPAGKAQTFWYIPHTHWEGAVFKTREEYLQMGLPNILLVMEMLERHPDYKFVLDQACYVQPFIERYPELVPKFKKFISDGRLEIVGGMDVMPDVNMPCGESFIRQVLYGKGYFRKSLGIDVKVGWLLDTFGHHAQMPQLLRSAGFDSYWFARGVPRKDTPAEFNWKGLDGTTIPAFWTGPYSYAVMYFAPKTYPEFSKFARQKFEILGPFFPGPDRVGMAGADVSIPEPQVPDLVKQFNSEKDSPFKIRIGVPSEYEKVAATHGNRPTIGGERNPIFQGCYSSRIELKKRTRELERLLLNAEKMNVLGTLVGLPAEGDHARVWQAWEPTLFNQTHDCMGGVMTDRVYESALSGYDASESIVNQVLTDRTAKIVEHIDTRGEGVPLVVFNDLSWERSDVAEVEIGFSDPHVKSIRVVNENGEPVPSQLIAPVRCDNQGIVQARVAFVASNIPALGYAVYRATPVAGSAADDTPATKEAKDARLENESYRVQLDSATGAVEQILVKDGQWNALRAPGNVVAMQEDRGDFWELYHNLDGLSWLSYTNTQQVPAPGKARFSNEFRDKPGKITAGPVFSEFEVAHPLGDKGRFQSKVRLARGGRRIEFSTDILNESKYVRYQAIFPTSIDHGVNVQEIPFGASERPLGVEFPAQNWVDCSNKSRGVAVLNRGLPGNVVTSDGTMLLSLMRTTSINSYGFGGGYEPGMSSESGFELGKKRSFRYAIVPHSGSWQDAELYRSGLEFNNPLVVKKATPHPGRLPNKFGIVSISDSNVIVSAVKPGENGGTIVRLYEAAGKPAKNVRLRCHAPVKLAQEVNLMEDPKGKLDSADNTVAFAMRPFEIKTIQLQLEQVK